MMQFPQGTGNPTSSTRLAAGPGYIKTEVGTITRKKMGWVVREATMFHVALWEPEIAANTGNIGRLCLGAGATLHLVGALGFQLDDRSVRRAGVDHWDEVQPIR